MDDQKLTDDFLIHGILPPGTQPGGFKELWKIMTDEQREKANKVWEGYLASNKVDIEE